MAAPGSGRWVNSHFQEFCHKWQHVAVPCSERSGTFLPSVELLLSGVCSAHPPSTVISALLLPGALAPPAHCSLLFLKPWTAFQFCCSRNARILSPLKKTTSESRHLQWLQRDTQGFSASIFSHFEFTARIIFLATLFAKAKLSNRQMHSHTNICMHTGRLCFMFKIGSHSLCHCGWL